MKERDLDELLEGATPEERDRLRHAHALLLAAGAPPELPPELAELPSRGKARKRPPILSTLPPRRLGAAITVAAGIAALAFGLGFLIGAGNDGPARAELETVATIPMKPTEAAPGSAGVLRIGKEAKGGNTPMILTVSGLEPLSKGGYYELWLTKERGEKQERVVSCGTFVATERDLSVRLNAPYRLKESPGWVVTRHERGAKSDPMILTT